jgi:orsellinic acid C2-O-methyltransferase
MIESLTPSQRMLDMIGSAWVTRALCTAAELGIADHLPLADAATSQGVPLQELVRQTACHADHLERLLDALCSLQVCVGDAQSGYRLTPLGATLRADHPQSVQGWALWWGQNLWPLWGQMTRCVQTGQTARQLLHGTGGYEHLNNPQTARQFHAAMTSVSRMVGESLTRALDWSGVRQVLDVGGGQGELVVQLLRAHAHLRAGIQDLPHALAGAQARLQAEGLADRCTLVGESFFERVQPGADVLLLKSILHNWNDAQSETILSHCREALPEGGRVVLIERLLPEAGAGALQAHDYAAQRSDLNMLVSLPGRERRLSEYRAMFEQAGLQWTRSVPLAPEFHAIEAVKPVQASSH